MASFKLDYRDKHKQGVLFAERVGGFRSRRNREDSIDVGIHKINACTNSDREEALLPECRRYMSFDNDQTRLD